MFIVNKNHEKNHICSLRDIMTYILALGGIWPDGHCSMLQLQHVTTAACYNGQGLSLQPVHPKNVLQTLMTKLIQLLHGV